MIAGWKLVPVEPTEEMFQALRRGRLAYADLVGDAISRERTTQRWQAMLEAAATGGFRPSNRTSCA